MAELEFRSPGVSTTEIDLSTPSISGPVGIPAGVIGTSNEGPAFVPVTVADYRSFSQIFGTTDGKKFGPLAVNEFLKNAKALTYVKILGIGDGKQRADSGAVTNAGFTVGEQQVHTNGTVGYNRKAVYGGDLGRTWFLGAFMSESAGSTIFSDAGLQSQKSTVPGSGLPGKTAQPIIRGILLAPSGVIPLLSTSAGSPSAVPSATQMARADLIGSSLQGSLSGTVNMNTRQFTLLLNGHTKTDIANNVITASFDPQSNDYFGNILNTDPAKIEEKGHLLYAHYDIDQALAVITGSSLLSASYGTGGTIDPGWEDVAFITTGSEGRNAGTTTQPNYESFTDRYKTPRTPFFISQGFGGVIYSLFRVHSISDGAVSNSIFKISIENLKPSTSETYLYGTFDLIVRSFSDTDTVRVSLEEYRGVTLDPSSDRYIARVIGDQNTYFDFDQPSGAQKMVVDGDHPINSNYIRVEMSERLKAGQVPNNAMPVGFRGHDHLVTSGSAPLTGLGTKAQNFSAAGDVLKRAIQPPVPFRKDIVVGTAPNLRAKPSLYWGVRFDRQLSVTLGKRNNTTTADPTIKNLTKYLPNFQESLRNVSVGNNHGTADSGGTVLDCDKFNNNIFSLERLRIVTASDGVADPTKWVSSSYFRDGTILTDDTNKYRALKVTDLKSQANRKFAKYTCFLQGGFDGVNIFNKDKSEFLNAAVKREIDDSTNQGGTSGPTVAAYRKALDIIGTKADVDIQLLAIPGIRHSTVTDYAIDAVEDRFDAMYIMDIEERDSLNTVMTSSASRPHVKNTVSAFKNRGLNSSFAAAYFPDVIVTDPTTSTNVRVPPSVTVLGAFSLNDAVGYPWFAPAGFNRGAMSSVLYATLPLNKENLDELYDADINPLTSFPNTGVMVFGQKTLLSAKSALDRVNVRRLLISIRRSVRSIANSMLFEPNRQETLDRFNALVNPILQSVQERSGLDRYKVIIDTTTTTQADVENNTLRGKIFVQPTRTAEFVALDFVVTNAGDAFENA